MNHLIINNKNKFWMAGLFLCLISIVLENFHGGLVLFDPFHHGEFFASAVSFFSTEHPDFEPLTIHGALDFIPALLARSIWGPDHYFLPTLALYKTLNILAAFVFVLIVFELTRKELVQWIPVLACAVMAPFLVGYRDLLLLLSLYLFVFINRRHLHPSKEMLVLILFGIFVALGLFWSFDRGIACALSLGAAYLIMSYQRKIHSIALIFFGVTVIVIMSSFRTFSVLNYVENIKFLMDTSSQWMYAWRRDTYILTGFTLTINLVVMMMILNAHFHREILKNQLPEIIAFAFLSIFMFKIGTNRADLFHIYMSLGIPVLFSFVIFNEDIRSNMYINFGISCIVFFACCLTIKYNSFGFLLVAGAVTYAASSKLERLSRLNVVFIIFIASTLAAVLNSQRHFFLDGKYKWLMSLVSPPNNFTASPDAIRLVSQKIIKSKSKCVFDLSNHGLINGLSNLPSCTRFTYPVYANRKYETEIIQTIQKSSPHAIVYSSTYGSYSIDGKNMRNRFPLLDVYLLEHYKIQECLDGYCIRYSKG
jgi:hypothetical protein